MNDIAGESLLFCLFGSKDTLNALNLLTMVCIPIKDELMAERRLQSLLYATPKDEETSSMFKHFDYTSYPKTEKYKKYTLPPEYFANANDGNCRVGSPHAMLVFIGVVCWL